MLSEGKSAQQLFGFGKLLGTVQVRGGHVFCLCQVLVLYVQCKGYLYLDRIAKTDCPLYRGKDIDETIYRKHTQLYSVDIV